jgi:hypothetical protein
MAKGKLRVSKAVTVVVFTDRRTGKEFSLSADVALKEARNESRDPQCAGASHFETSDALNQVEEEPKQ